MKKVLFIAPPFFDYPSVILKGLREEFDHVSYYSSIPSNLLYKVSWYFESLLGIKFFKKGLMNAHHKSIQNELERDKTDFNIVFIIKGSFLPIPFYDWLKNRYSQAIFVQYLWDDVCNDPGAIKVIPFFDKTFSYNPDDCQEYNFQYRPFFYDDCYASKQQEKVYDISCFMSFSRDRITILNKLFNEEILSLNNCIVIKASRVLQWLNRKITQKLLPYFRTKGVDYNEMLNILQKSKCQIDIPHEKQKGLTTRAFETLATKTKLITTNRNITGYDFYNPQNILIISRDNPIIDPDWINQPYLNYSDEVLDHYSLSCFIREMLGDNE